jgi:hypothetical protein
MLRRHEIQFIKENIAPRTAPVLSLYLNVNPAEPTNANRAWLTRVKDSMKGLDVPREVTEKAIHELEAIRPAARTFVVFAADDLIQLYALQVDLPVVDLAHGQIEARWGEPYVFPLVYAIDEYARHGVVLLDRAKWRFFEVYLGEISEVADAFLDLPLDHDHTRKLEKRPAERWVQASVPSERSVQGSVVLRGGGEGDHYERHVEAWVQRFYKRAAHILEKLVTVWNIDELIFMGPHVDTHYFEQYLPKVLRQRVAGHAPALPESSPSAGEVLQKAAPIIADRQQAAEMALLDEIRDIGRWTIPTVLKELQMGRFHLLVAPWNPNGNVLQCAKGLVVTDQREAEAYCPGQSVRPVALRDVLVDLATAHGARLEFVHGEAESRLLREFGGLAALSRW